MADFNFYLNRQGVRGRKGDKGEQGFSPVITEYDTGNPLEYVLRIQTEDGVMYTQNLRPEFVNNGGTYLRFNQSNNVFSIDAADYATTSSQGEVRLANSGDVAALTSTTTAVTPKDVDTILTNKGYAASISNLQSNVSDLDGDLTSLYGTVTNLSGTVNSLSNTVTANYNNTVKLTGNQTIAGNKTFTDVVRTNSISTQDGQKTMIDYNSSSNSMRIGGASTSNVYLRTSSTGKLIHTKDGAEYEVYDTSNLTAGNNININNGVISATDTTYTAGRGIGITNGEISVSNIVVDTNSNQTISGDKYFSGSNTFAHLEVESIEISGGEANWLTYNGSGGVTLGRTDANHITLPSNSQDLIQVTRGGNTYTNIDSGNIATYAPVPTITDGTGIDVSVNGNTYTISVDNTVVKTTGYQTISGTKTFTATQFMTGLCCSRIMSYDDMSRVYIECLGSGGSYGGINIGGANDNVRLILANPTNTVTVRRNGTNYINVDSGNIGNYITGADSTFSDVSTNALQNKVITDSLMDFNNGSYVIYGSPTINSDVISNLSTTNYIETKYKFNCTSSDAWELTVWISGFDYTTSPFVLTNSVDGTKSIEMGFSGEKAYLKASSDGSTWDIADAIIGDTSNFIGGDKGFRIRYHDGNLYTYEVNSGGYSTQYRSFSGAPYNTNSPIRIYSSVTDNTLSIDLSKSAMSVNNVTVWDGAAGELICTPKFPQSSDIRAIDKKSQAEYDALVEAGTVDASTLYIIV